MEMQQRPTQKQERHFPWIRAIVALFVSLLISAAAILLILSTEHVLAGYWLVIIPIFLAAFGQLIPLYQYLLPISTETKNDLPIVPPPPFEVKVTLTPPVSEPVTQNNQTRQPTGIWTVPYRRNPYFTGREGVLRALHEHLSTAKTSVLTQSQAISGLGGVGKTQIAVEYAYRHRQDYHSVLWVNAETRDAILKSFLELATQFALPEQHEADQAKVVAAVNRWFVEHDQWLLIFDNADDLSLAEEFLPTSDTGHLILTTRDQAPGVLAESLDIKTMNKDEGTLLVLRRAKLLARDAQLAQVSPNERAQAEQIVLAMDGLPLALDQAAAYIEETRCTLTTFLETYQQQFNEILRRRGRSGKEHPLPVATTWSLSFTQVMQLNPAAADLLRVCTFLAPDAIPEELIVDGAAELGPCLETWKNNTTYLDEAIATLSRFSLLHRDREERAISLHRLVQAAQLLDMDGTSQRIWAERTVRAVNKAFPLVEFTTWPKCERFLPHATKCCKLIEKYLFVFPEAARLLNLVASYLDDRAQYTEAEPLYQRALAIREQALGPNHPSTATSLNNLALLYHNQGKYEQAEPFYQRALAILDKTLGPQHPNTKSGHANYASLLESMKRKKR